MKMLRISADLTLPLETVTDTIGVIAVKGAGKTFTFLVLAEEMIAKGIPVVIFDPIGVCWGLRSSADGKHKGLPVVVLGGSHGDLPLDPQAGKMLADFLVAERRSFVFDFSSFETKADQIRFSQAFLSRFYEKNRQPFHVFLDEADDVAPQKPFGEETRLLRAAEVLVRRGRARGIGVTMVTQRPAVLNKNILTQCGTLVIGRTTSPQDRKAIEAWADAHGTAEQKKALWESIASLPTNEKWIWSPMAGIFKRVRVRDRDTFDSSATPKLGQVRAMPSEMAPVDLKSLEAKMTATIEKAKHDDPILLRRRIDELVREIKKAPIDRVTEVRTEKIKVEVPVLSKRELAVFERLAKAIEDGHAKLATFGEEIVVRLTKIQDRVEQARMEFVVAQPKIPPRTVKKILDMKVTLPRASRDTSTGDGSLPTGERSILLAVAQLGTPDRIQLTMMTGKKPSTRNAYIQRLAQREYVEVSGDTITITPKGSDALGPFSPLPEGQALRDFWIAKVPAGEAALLAELFAAYPKGVSREDLTARTGYKPSTRNAYLQRLAQRKIIDTTRDPIMRAPDFLF